MAKKKIGELKSLTQLGENIGLLFQLVDDFIDFKTDLFILISLSFLSIISNCVPKVEIKLKSV